MSSIGKDQTKEAMELTSRIQLELAALADARAKVLELERSGYQRSRAV